MSKASFVKTVAIMFGGVIMAAPAFAGFEWSPPPPPPARSVIEGPAVPAAPPTPVESVVLTPESAAADQYQVNPFNMPAPHSEQQLDSDPLDRGAVSGVADMPRAVPAPRSPHRDPAAQSPVHQERLNAAPFMKAEHRIPAAPASAPVYDYPEAVGFGRDIPLAIAMQQIVPPGYAYAFGDGVNPGMRVNWDGGQPWNEVLQQAVRGQGLTIDVTGNTVWVGPHTARPARAAPPAFYNPFAAAPAPIPSSVPVVAADTPPADGWRPVNDWRAEDNYTPSYPRRNAAAARERMMLEAAQAAQAEEPSAHDPQKTAEIDSAAYDVQDSFAPIPLMVEEQPAGRSYTQLTGLEDKTQRRLDTHEIRYWQARAGESLKDVLRNWAEQAGVHLFWAEGHDYTLLSGVQMHGTFQSAVTKLLENYNGQSPQPQGQLHPNMPSGPAVLIIDHM